MAEISVSRSASRAIGKPRCSSAAYPARCCADRFGRTSHSVLIGGSQARSRVSQRPSSECLVDWPGEPGTMLATLIDLRLVDERPSRSMTGQIISPTSPERSIG